jgi:hypothetical protein
MLDERCITSIISEYNLQVFQTLRIGPMSFIAATESFFDNGCLPSLNLQDTSLNRVVDLKAWSAQRKNDKHEAIR